MAATMKEYGWKIPEAQRANLTMVEENMEALENGVQASAAISIVNNKLPACSPAPLRETFELSLD